MIEDDEEIAELLALYLQQFGFQIENYINPNIGIEKIRDSNFELLILDLSLPNLDGLEVLKIIREFSDIPIIISSARGSVSDKVKGLNSGADDYLPKPYEPIELIARVKAVLKRVTKTKIHQGFFINKERLEISKNGKILELTKAEFEILKLFVENQGKIFSRDQILENTSSMEWSSVDRSVDVLISRIRNKIGDSDKNYIKSVRGFGYKFI
jgi:two-component system OmpR family response regulator